MLKRPHSLKAITQPTSNTQLTPSAPQHKQHTITMGKTSTAAKRSTTSGAMTASSSTSSSGKELSAMPSTELQDLGALAKQMEEQLMQEFEALLTARRKQESASAGGKTGALKASASSNRNSSGNNDQDAQDALSWKHMYERLRDLRETDAERLLRETVQHAEEREKSLLDVIAHLEAGGATSKSGKAGAKMDVRLSDVSLCGVMGGGGGGGGRAAAAMETEEQEGEEMVVYKQGMAEQEARIASLEGKMSDLKRILMAYQRFTSLCVTMERKASVPGGVSILSCTAINHVHKKAVKFSLKMNVDVEDNLGMDATFRPVANKELLPPFLQQEATLETKQCPLLLLSILKTLFDEKKNGAGKE